MFGASRTIVMAKRTQELMDEKAELADQISELQRDMAWSADTTMELSVAHLQSTQEIAALRQNTAQLEQELAMSNHRCRTLEADLATAGVLAAEGSMIATEEMEKMEKTRVELVTTHAKQKLLQSALTQAQLRAADENERANKLEASLSEGGGGASGADAEWVAQEMHQSNLALQTVLAEIAELEEAHQEALAALQASEKQQEKQQKKQKTLGESADDRAASKPKGKLEKGKSGWGLIASQVSSQATCRGASDFCVRFDRLLLVATGCRGPDRTDRRIGGSSAGFDR